MKRLISMLSLLALVGCKCPGNCSDTANLEGAEIEEETLVVGPKDCIKVLNASYDKTRSGVFDQITCKTKDGSIAAYSRHVGNKKWIKRTYILPSLGEMIEYVMPGESPPAEKPDT